MYRHKKRPLSRYTSISKEMSNRSLMEPTHAIKKRLTAPNKGHAHCDVKKWSPNHPRNVLSCKANVSPMQSCKPLRIISTFLPYPRNCL